MHEFFEVVTLEQAQAHATGFASTATEQVPLVEAVGRVTAEDVQAAEDVPDFARATMDGYAVKAASTFGASESNPAQLQISGSVDMGELTTLSVGPGEAARILTGGMVPAGADAVLMIEHTEAIDEQTIEAYRGVAPGQHVVQRGEDLHKGETLVQRGTRLRPQEIGLLAALGLAHVHVHARPIVAIISTGDEVVPIEARLRPGQVRDVNSYSLAAAVRQAGGVAKLFGIVGDDFDALLAVARRAVSEADMVLLSGGSSVGSRDFTIEVIRALPDAEVLLHGVSIRPGKPTILARVGEAPFWGLPGHVTSAMVVFRVLVSQCLARLAGQQASPNRPRRIPARLRRNVSSVHGRVDYVRVQLCEEEGQLWAEPVLGPSGLLRTMVLAEGLVEIARDVEGLDADSDVWVLPLS